MKVLVTGATGFLGSSVVSAALDAGHEVIAVRRPAAPVSLIGHSERLSWLSADLREAGNLREALRSVEGVIHCAAATSGDFSTQLAGTVVGTENLLASLPDQLRRFVLVSTFSVYDFDAPRLFGVLSEDTPLEARPLRRDAYTQTKLIQERLVRDFARNRQIPLVVARPGAIYGPSKTWDYGRALAANRLDLIFAPLARMRLIHVDNCADALVASLSNPIDNELIVNLVDSEQPSHWRFHRLARRAGASAGVAVPVPYLLVLAIGATARLTSWLFFGGRARLPEALDPARQRARWRPLRYARARAEEAFSLPQRTSLASGIAGMIRRETEAALRREPE